jgi:uncharacterized protein (TIGR02302 family)
MREAPPTAQDRPGPGALEIAAARLRRPLRLTWAGLLAERAARAFWPAWSLLFLGIAALAFGVQDVVPSNWFAVLAVVSLLLIAVAIGLGLRRFHWPHRVEALDRLDRTLPGRPLTALADTQAIGAGDPASKLVWQAHVLRMAERAAAARPALPDLRLSSRDPYALRYAALLAAVMALGFGAPTRLTEVAEIALPGGADAMIARPSWEGWVRPPAYTGKPTIYLNEVRETAIAVPEGSVVTVRLYGEVGILGLDETLSGRADPAEDEGPAADFEIVQSGSLAITGPGGRQWDIAVIGDEPPRIVMSGPIQREADGLMSQPFRVRDDYGVVAGKALIELDLDAVDRRHGLAPEPEPREALVLDLPMPLTGRRDEFTESLIENLSEHPWANLPVKITLSAEDARGQVGESDTQEAVLPAKRFFDPLAGSVAEMRRDLLWSREAGPRVAQILRAVTHLPEGFIRDERAFLMLRVAVRRLESAMAGGMTAEVRDELAAELWEIALLIEQGDLDSARERLERAQDRLSEAMRNGADQSEIDELMQELREAMRDYMNMLAQEAQRDPDRQQALNEDSMEVTGDQLAEMLERLQQLMEEGRMDEAAELLEMLRQMMENMQIAEGQGGEGGPGQEAMRGLAETLRGQQGLNDDTFRDLQDQFGSGERGGQQPGEGEGTGQGLSERQQGLREQLGQQRGQLPGRGTPQGDAADEALDRAERSMEEAERALREGENAEALDRQAEAMDALRDGIRNLGEALAEQQQGGQGDQQAGRADPDGMRDPLGRESGATGRLGTQDDMLQGEDVYRRAQELLEELRRRSGDQARPEVELDYLRRLLDRF